MFVVLACVLSADPGFRLDAELREFLHRHPEASVSVGLVTGSQTRFAFYGCIPTPEGRKSPSERTVYEIGSITKTMTGLMLAERVLAGKAKLDDAVVKYLPEKVIPPQRDDREISLLHLATHTSSLPRMPANFIFVQFAEGNDSENPYAQFRLADMTRALKSQTLTRPIGSRFDYSNWGMGLLGMAVTQMNDAKTYEEALKKRVLQPLKISDTCVVMDEETKCRLAPALKANGKPTKNWDFDCFAGCGAIRSTPKDMCRYVQAILKPEETPLQKEFTLATQSWYELELVNGRRRSIGLGYLLELQQNKPRFVFHDGGTGGYSSIMIADRQTGRGIVILTNIADGGLNRYAFEYLRSSERRGLPKKE